jgi:pyruvate dehydrogenase complex dehydrogenase (E1) component
MLTKLLADKQIGKYIVPIVPDEARTFGMESLFRKIGIYSHVGQNYEPVDSDSLLYYKEATDGQILEEGITEAGPCRRSSPPAPPTPPTASTWSRSSSSTPCSASSASAT